jgi:hypothetical protein
MSKRKILVTIDCNAKTCGDCNYNGCMYCELFVENRGEDESGEPMRSRKCLRAEKEAKR